MGGISGGIQVTEPANLNITTVDLIRRFGGSTSTAAQWPEEENAGDDEDDRIERLEKMVERFRKRAAGGGGGGRQAGSALGRNTMGASLVAPYVVDGALG